MIDVGKKILAFDTSWDYSVVATLEGIVPVEKFEGYAPRAASEGLVPWIMGVIEKSGWNKKDIELIAAGRGPGSFTGTRIAVTTAKILAWSLNIPVVAVCSAKTLAISAGSDGETVAVVKDARKGEVMFGLYSITKKDGIPDASVIIEPSLFPADEIWRVVEDEILKNGKKLVVIGDDCLFKSEKFDLLSNRGVFKKIPDRPVDPSAIAVLALKKYMKGESDNPFLLEPVYLRGF